MLKTTEWFRMMHHHAGFSSGGDIVQMNIHWNFEPFLWPWPCSAIQSVHKTIQLMMMCHQTRFSCKRISSSVDKLESRILIIQSFTVTVILKTADQSFWETIWLILTYNHTKFGYKKFSDSEDIIWKNIHWHFEILLWPLPWPHKSNFSIKHSGLW